MALSHTQIDDLVLMTQDHLIERGAFTGLQTDLVDFVGTREIWGERKTKFNGGRAWQHSLQMDHNHSARTVGMYENDGSSVHDTMQTAEVGARHINAHYLYDMREPSFQQDGKAIVDLLVTKYTGMRMSFHELLESLLWSKPVDASDLLTPYGLAYWVVKNAAEGFNGGNPAGFPQGCGGLSSVEWPRWRNYTAQYSQVTKEDLIRKMRRAHRRTNFRSPVSHASPTFKMSNGIYVGDAVISTCEEILESQNMNLGNDLASKDGRAVFKGTPLTYAPKLDLDSTDPIYMLDWKYMTVGVMPGWENNLSKPYMVPGKHLVRRVDLDVSLNMICTDRRRQAVISK